MWLMTMPSGGVRDAVNSDRVSRNVHELAVLFDEEVVVVRRVGVEIGLAAVDRELAQKAGLGELMQRIVDGGERHLLAGCRSFGV